jgi:hypothetical protein
MKVPCPYLVHRDYTYAWRCGWRWVFSYLRGRKLVAAIRTVWFTLVLGHISEACQECGMPYLLWWADDDLYARVTGRGRYENGEAASGLFCLECFDRMAKEKGFGIRWKPEATT